MINKIKAVIWSCPTTIRPEELLASDVSLLPIIAEYVGKWGIVDELNRLTPRREVSAGRIVMALPLDTLSGRRPLYKIEQSSVHRDMELLFDTDIPSTKFNDDAMGCSMDPLFESGTRLILTEFIFSAVKRYNLDTENIHHHITSEPVYEDYALYQDSNHSHIFAITRDSTRTIDLFQTHIRHF